MTGVKEKVEEAASNIQIRSFILRVALSAKIGHSIGMCNVKKLSVTVCLSQGTECHMPTHQTVWEQTLLAVQLY